MSGSVNFFFPLSTLLAAHTLDILEDAINTLKVTINGEDNYASRVVAEAAAAQMASLFLLWNLSKSATKARRFLFSFE